MRTAHARGPSAPRRHLCSAGLRGWTSPPWRQGGSLGGRPARVPRRSDCPLLRSLGRPPRFGPRPCPAGVPCPPGTSCPPSSLPAQLKEARPHLAFGSHVWAQGSGVTTDGSVGPGFLSGRPRATQCPIVPQPLPEASSGRGGPGRRCQLFWVTGEDLDLLAASFFLRRKVNGPSLGSTSVPLARIPETSRLPLWRRERPVSLRQAGAPRAAAFSAPGRWAHHCSHERLPPLGSLCNFGGPNCRPLRIQNPRLTAPGLGVAPQHTEPGNGAHGTPHSALGVECVC